MKRFVKQAISVGAWGGIVIAGGIAAGVLTGRPTRGQTSSDLTAAPATNPSVANGTDAPADHVSHVTMPLIPGMASVAPNTVASATTRETKDDLLGNQFKSVSSGIAFKPPAASRQVQPKEENQIVEFDSDLRPGWTLIAKKMPFTHDMVLTTSNGHPGVPIIVTDPPKPPHTTPTTRVVVESGVLEQYLVQLKRSYGELNVLRSDTIYAGQTGTLNIGMLAVQYTYEGQRELKQIALVQRDPQQFFVLELTTPGSDNADSPLLRDAAATFSQMMDSIVLVDQSPLRDEQDARIMHTEALFGGWTEKNINDILIAQRYLRIIRDGKDVGYVYATEKPFKESGLPAVRIAMRMHRNDGSAGPTDSQTIMVSTIDYHHSHEQWSTLLTVPNLKNSAPDEYSEIGASDFTTNIPVAVPAEQGGGFKMTQKYGLTVTGSLPDTGPEHRDIDLPQFYLPQALQYLLPRIIQHNAGALGKYMFYSWVPSTHEVMALYCDVLPADRVRFNGQTVTAFQIKTHFTLDGPPTTDFLDLTGNYLGAQSDRVDENKKTTQEIVVPCDADTLTKIWGHPNLSTPGEDASATN